MYVVSEYFVGIVRWFWVMEGTRLLPPAADTGGMPQLLPDTTETTQPPQTGKNLCYMCQSQVLKKLFSVELLTLH